MKPKATVAAETTVDSPPIGLGGACRIVGFSVKHIRNSH
jgi:hypothetical protein